MKGKKWISEDKSFSLIFPSDIEFIKKPSLGKSSIFLDKLDRFAFYTFVKNSEKSKSREEKFKQILDIAGSFNYPGLGSKDVESVEMKTVINGYPVGISIIAFTHRTRGRLVGMTYAIGTPSKTYIICFVHIKYEYFDELRPTFEGVANSFELI